MTTLVGKQADFADALNELLELDYDAVEAYQAAIHRLNNADYKSKLSEFMGDHAKHVNEITALLKKHNKRYATKPSGKQWLTKGKVILADLISEDSVLSAMLTNENDTNVAYTRMNERTDKWPDAIDIIKNGLQDEKRHKLWLKSVTEK
jgi:hypothetical protein